MATNPPDEIILVRGTSAYKEYMRQFGWLKGLVNGLEDGLSISGRALLLIFILYTTIKAGMTLGGHELPWWVDTIMLGFQVCGLEGAIPGLSRLRETLLAKNTTVANEDAETVRKAIHSARVLNMLTGVEILLAAYSALSPTIFGFNISIAEISKFYGYALLLYRLWKITEFIGAMARMESSKPKIISQEEFDQQQAEKEQQQTRLDNTAIQASINQALDAWTLGQDQQQQVERKNLQASIDEALNRWTAQRDQEIASQLESQRQDFASLKQSNQMPGLNVDDLTEAISASLNSRFEAKIEAAKQESEAEIRRKIEAVRRENEAETRRQIEAVRRENEAHLGMQREASQRSNEASRRNADVPTNPRHEAARPPAVPGILPLPVNGDRAAQKAMVFRLIDEEHVTTYKAGELTNVPSGTVQRWLKERKDALERKVAEQQMTANGLNDEAREA